ncbi:hypothetical protein FGB62_19g141 [Gracilaria domingensis]|nr:hypothetical protein FGB62_19g141 [Gracilaria domingensis]
MTSLRPTLARQITPALYTLSTRSFTERAAGPGGLFRSKIAVVNPSKQQANASRKRLRRARTALDDMRLPQELQNEQQEHENQFESEEDIRGFVEARIQESMRTGQFDNLKNKGRPLPHQPSSTHEYAMRIMRDNGLRPYWLQLMHDIDSEKRQLRNTLAYAWHTHMPHAPHRWALAVRIMELRIESVNKRVDTFNLVRPMSVSHLFRLRLRIKEEIERAMKSKPVGQADERELPEQVPEKKKPPIDETEPRHSWQLFARFVRATDVREYKRPTWGRRKSDKEEDA